ncbi:replication-relaxation family protein [Streptomyces sp. NPDC058739]|uniref:replication-relaxation family protein n=1 Tax=Streptomyces sp. NPDC058739 TaxID=3346618 RepID=UPI0036A87834
MPNVDAGAGDRLALAVLAQYRMTTTEQMHRLIAPGVRVEQTRRRLQKLREEGLAERITLPQAGRTRVWFATQYGVRVAAELPELRGWRPPRGSGDKTAARFKAGHALTVTETALAFHHDARRRGDTFRPLDWIPEVYHQIGNGEAVIPDALMYYWAHDRREDGGFTMLRAFVEVDRATMGPERLAAKLDGYHCYHQYTPAPAGRRRTVGDGLPQEEWRRRYPVFPRLLFVLDGTGPAGIENRITALHASRNLPAARLLHQIPVMAASMTDLRQHGPTAPIWRPILEPDRKQAWM